MRPRKPPASRAAVIVTVVAVAVILSCLSFGTVAFFTLRHDDGPDQAAGRPATAPPTAEPDPTEEATGGPGRTYGAHRGDIRQFVVARPSGTRAWQDAPSDQSLDLNAAAVDFANQGQGKAALQHYHFVDGYLRRWVDGDQNRVTVRILRFASASDGDNFTNFFIDSNQGGNWGDPQPVPGIDTAAGFVEDQPMRDGFQRAVAVGDAGDIVALVVADQTPPAGAAVPDAELLDEFALL